MAISRKPHAHAAKEDVDVEKLINKGGSVPHAVSPSPESKKKATVPLRFSDVTLLERIDKAVAKHPVKISRNTWIHYAITEKLERDGC